LTGDFADLFADRSNLVEPDKSENSLSPTSAKIGYDCGRSTLYLPVAAPIIDP
jgi:hypothetical protein